MPHVHGARLVAAAVLACLVVTAQAALAATGGRLDPSFGAGGVVRVGSPRAGYTQADHLVVRAGPTGRIFLFEDMSSGDTSDSGFIRARTSSGGTLTGFRGGTIPFVASSADGTVRSLGLAPLSDGGLVSATIVGDVAMPPAIRTVRYAADGHVAAAHNGLPGAAASQEDSVTAFTRLPGGSIRACATTTAGVGPASIRLTGLTPALGVDTRLGPDGFRVLPLDNCQGITSDPAGHIYVARGVTTLGGNVAIEVLALTSSGAVITSWGDDGRSTFAVAGSTIAVAGSCDPSPRSMMRTFDDGSVVIPFDVRTPGTCTVTGGGIAWLKKTLTRIVMPGPDDGRTRIFAMDVDANDRTIVSFGYWPAGGSPQAYIERLTTVGIGDPTFGAEGLLRVSRAPRDLDVDALGRILGVTADGATVVMTRRK